MLKNTKVSKKLQSGVTMIEYALIAALIAVVAVAAVKVLGTTISAMFTTIGTSI